MIATVEKVELAKKTDKENEREETLRRTERLQDEINARIIDEYNDTAMKSCDFQMLNIKGKLLAHPSRCFLDEMSNLRQSIGRETYPHRINHARRFFQLGFNKAPLPSWSVAMGTASFVPFNRMLLAPKDTTSDAESDESDKPTFFSYFEPTKNRPANAYTDSFSSLAVMVWYPVLTYCMSSGDKLSCIALRDTCTTLRQCYGLFRNDTTRLEQFVFDLTNSSNAKQLDWVARRIEVPLSPPQTPPREVVPPPPPPPPPVKSDPFRAPAVIGRRWADYDDDDDSLGSPMSLPHSGNSNDVPELDLDSNSIRRPPTEVIAVPTLTNIAPWFNVKKTLFPVPRVLVLLPEEYPRLLRSESTHSMKLQSSTSKPFPLRQNQKIRGRLEHWVREDVEKNLKTRLSLALAARKKAGAETEMVVYNRFAALSGLNSGDLTYVGEPDLFGVDIGICVEDIQELIIGRFKLQEKEKIHQSKIALIPSPDGWICKEVNK
ncbi:hypothetical protein Clacol_008901 [Clathrus columnatus]|uniref:Uncharacterized protein n=1 Tax=Clathrus columnatus TaxID=1419009 RepID=A0AAV5ARX2_9AGAM|nr:hypothetical protein Clacol_008901 [Clathrus columnatus]